MPGSLESRGERRNRSRMVRENFEKAAIFFVLCESNLNILKLVHMVDMKKTEDWNFILHLRYFYIQNNKMWFL